MRLRCARLPWTVAALSALPLVASLVVPCAPSHLTHACRAPAPSATLLDTLREGASQAHATECADAALNFPTHACESAELSFTDDDFVTYRIEPNIRVGPDLAGPDAGQLHGANRIHTTRRSVLSDSEIAALMAEARAAIAAGMQSNFTYTKEHRLGEVHVADLPAARDWLTHRLADTFYPMCADRYGLKPSTLRVFDSLVINYDASRGAVRQPVHRDASLLSINVALSDHSDYDGGGTFFEALPWTDGSTPPPGGGAPRADLHATREGDRAPGGVVPPADSRATLSLARGHAMCHPSGLRHAGRRITRGERWVLVIFLLCTRVAHIPRRAAELGWDAMHRRELNVADAILSAAVAMDGDDHELHYGLAQVYAMQGRPREARERLLAAMRRYALSPKPPVALGSLLMQAGRFRAALRWFERTLDLVADPSDDEGWEAALCAARCSMRLAQAHPLHARLLTAHAALSLQRALTGCPEERRAEIKGWLRDVQERAGVIGAEAEPATVAAAAASAATGNAAENGSA